MPLSSPIFSLLSLLSCDGKKHIQLKSPLCVGQRERERARRGKCGEEKLSLEREISGATTQNFSSTCKREKRVERVTSGMVRDAKCRRCRRVRERQSKHREEGERIFFHCLCLYVKARISGFRCMREISKHMRERERVERVTSD